MKFFVPQAKRTQYQSSYDDMIKVVKDQLRLPITDRRIFSIDFNQEKKRWRAEVGGLDPQEGRYEVVAIFEAKPHIIVTRATNGNPGPTILVGNDEITDIVDFE